MKRLAEYIQEHALIRPDAKAFVVKRRGKWESLSYGRYLERARDMSLFLTKSGVQPGDRIMVWTVNCPGWNVADLAISLSGGIMVSVFPNADEDTVKQMLIHAEPVLVFVSGPLQKDTVIKAWPAMEGRVFQLDLVEGFIPGETDAVAPAGKRPDSSHSCPDDVSVLFYTSGTSGLPKAVMHTAGSMMMTAHWVCRLFSLGPHDTAVCILPVTFIYERIHNYAYQIAGVTVYYSGLAAEFSETLQEVKPSFFVAVPQILLQLFQTLTSGAGSTGITAEALKYALEHDPSGDIAKDRLPAIPVAYEEIFRGWREKTGGRVSRFSFGAAAMPDSVARFFWNIGIPALMAYGSNEMSLAANNFFPGGSCVGSVGLPVDTDVHIRIQQGEVQVKTPAFMKGYYRDDTLTSSVITPEGWYRTGDSGEWKSDRFLTITGRLDDLFKAANGRFVNPFEIEQIFAAFALNGFVVAVPDTLQRICLLLNSSEWEHSHNQKLKEAILRHNNEQPDKQIAAYCHIMGIWSPESGELTPNLKLKRNFIREKYADYMSNHFVYVI